MPVNPASVHPKLVSTFREGAGVKLHVVEGGEGPMVVFLHGFPEFWYSWRHQLAALADNYHVVAPDLRGYNLSEKPAGVASYATSPLCDDIVALIQGYGKGPATVVAHDWGGVLAWILAARNPEVVARLVIMNAPHPKDHEKLVLTSLRQFLKSYYMYFFQIPGLPEFITTRDDAAAIRKTFRNSSTHPEAFTQEDEDAFAEAYLQPGAATAAINYYRAAGRQIFERSSGKSANRKIAAPTLVIWGTHDRFLSIDSVATMPHRCEGYFRLELVADSGHWVMQERPDKVNWLLREFLETVV